jgi:hypothetical protein
MVESPHDVGGGVHVQVDAQGAVGVEQFDDRALVGTELRLDALPQFLGARLIARRAASSQWAGSTTQVPRAAARSWLASKA